MWFWRVGRRPRWAETTSPTTAQVAEATRDLLLREQEEGLSVFQVAGEAGAERVAVLFAVTCRERPAHVDYVLIPPKCFASLPSVHLIQVPDTQLHPDLSARHYEAGGLTEELSKRLAEVILRHPGHQVHRLKDKNLCAMARRLVQANAILPTYLCGEWPGILLGPSSSAP